MNIIITAGHSLNQGGASFNGLREELLSIKEYGDTSDRPTGDQLYEGITYYNTDINKIERYSDGEWISLKIPASQNSASTVGDDYDKEEVQSILDELRDLKSKMRAAGLLEE